LKQGSFELKRVMLRNYIKIALRNIIKNKLFTAINVAGMTIGMTSFFLIGVFVWDEFQFDTHYPDAERTFRVYNIRTGDDGNVNYFPIVPPTFGPTMQSDFPEIESTARMLNILNEQLFIIGNKRFLQDKGVYAETSIFEMLSIELILGHPQKALINPNQIVISENISKIYFGTETPIGKIINLSGVDREITGVFKKLPDHSHLDLEYIMSFATVGYYTPKERMESWNWQQFYTYIKLREGVIAADLEAKFPAFVEKYAYPFTKPSGYTYMPHLQNVKDIHLHSSNFEWEIAKTGNYQTVYAMSAVALFILLIVCINFVNLSTARSLNRIKEVGVRKISGASRGHIVFQFLGESIILSLAALVIAGFFAEILLPEINNITGKNITINFLSNYQLLLFMVLFAFLLGALAGMYPAFYTSAIKPIELLKSKSTSQKGDSKLRIAMVVIQLSMSLFLIAGSIVVYQQLSFLQSKNLGFNREQLLILNLRGDLDNNLETTKSEFNSVPGVVSGTFSYGLPGGVVAGDLVIDPTNNKKWPANLFLIDAEYVKVMEMEIVAGRDFIGGSLADQAAGFIINETGAKNLGYESAEKAIGKPIHWSEWSKEPSTKEGEIIGVVKDFHFKSLREELSTAVLHIYPDAYRTLALKIETSNLQETLNGIEEKWKLLEAEWPFNYYFLDQNFDKMYKSENAMRTLFLLFTIIAVFISSMGLFGLIYYSSLQKQREIGIRKTLGASVYNIVFLMLKKFLVLTGVSLVLTIPLSYIAAYNWLQNYSYKIPLSPSIFLFAATLIIIIVLITLSYQTIKAASTNPVDVLKNN
jgi:putative ABC transport system permease protein